MTTKELRAQLLDQLNEALNREDDRYIVESLAIMFGRVIETSNPEKLIDEVKELINK
jgi:hypothetical protein